jgi:hypothetical protein
MMLPGYSSIDVISPYDVSKLSTNFSLYVRTTIPWKLSCEHNETYPMNRKTANMIFSQELGFSGSSGKIALSSFIFLVASLVTLVVFLMHDESEDSLKRY